MTALPVLVVLEVGVAEDVLLHDRVARLPAGAAVVVDVLLAEEVLVLRPAALRAAALVVLGVAPRDAAPLLGVPGLRARGLVVLRVPVAEQVGLALGVAPAH